jgi:glycosyltransferase involved in cell wall biosynthesis
MLTTFAGAGACQCAGLDITAVPTPAEESGTELAAILLSTFNGARFLTQQLHSYAGQTWDNWRLYWRDDGSTDRSAELVNSFAVGAGYGRCFRNDQEAHLGVSGSFFLLLQAAVTGPAAFFAFSDQDDIWLPNKLANGVAALRAIPRNKPALYFCRRARINESGAPAGQQAPLPRTISGLNSALTQNLIPGCCMILNRAAAELIVRSPLPDKSWHDWWSYIIVASCDGVVIPGASTDVLYRQHNGNLIGEDLSYSGRRLRTWLDRRASYYALFWRHVAELNRLRKNPRTIAIC